MKNINVLKKRGSKVVLLAAAPLAFAAQAYAAIPETAKTSIESAKTDGLELGWIVVGVFASIFVISIAKRLLR
ncbi:major capsid protein [Neisseria dentiae]|uniref:major capsid protein n=1 Tax=Neisseria dentiae TaxID=194197 RepID=UPI00211BA806|nr:major capsid protein [Neisseria dentiae]MCQ9327743.1 major capsid protein [Neisseria dentiae]